MDWSKERVLVTGATGFIGRHLVQRLAEKGAQIYACTSPAILQSPISILQSPISILHFDMRDAEAVKSAVEEADPSVVFHLAAAGVTDPSIAPALALEVNAGGAINLLEALRGRDVRRVVLVGTCHEYGAGQQTEVNDDRFGMECLDPFNAYAASKVAAWAFGRMYWRSHGLPVVTVRPFQVYGPGQSSRALIPAAIDAALAGDNFPMTPGEQERDFIYITDVVEGMLSAAETPEIDGESLDLGKGIAWPILQVVEQIWRLAGGTGEIRPGALPYRPGVVMHIVADAERTARLTGWRAQVPLEEGLKRTTAWMQRDYR